MQRQVQRLTLPSMALLFLLPSPQPLASTLSNTQHPPTTLLNMVLQATIIQSNMLLQEVTIMPAMLLRATMLPMAHTVVVATMLHMEVMVETPIQPLLLQHTGLQQQRTTKKEFVRMSGDNIFPKILFLHIFLSYVKPVDYIPGEVCCSTKVELNYNHIFSINGNLVNLLTTVQRES